MLPEVLWIRRRLLANDWSEVKGLLTFVVMS
jgi:hypothetical protein